VVVAKTINDAKASEIYLYFGYGDNGLALNSEEWARRKAEFREKTGRDPDPWVSSGDIYGE